MLEYSVHHYLLASIGLPIGKLPTGLSISRCVGSSFLHEVVKELGSTAVGLGLGVVPAAVVAALAATLGRRTARTREVTAGAIRLQTVTDICAVGQTDTHVVVHTVSTTPVRPHTDTHIQSLSAWEVCKGKKQRWPYLSRLSLDLFSQQTEADTSLIGQTARRGIARRQWLSDMSSYPYFCTTDL